MQRIRNILAFKRADKRRNKKRMTKKGFEQINNTYLHQFFSQDMQAECLKVYRKQHFVQLLSGNLC